MSVAKSNDLLSIEPRAAGRRIAKGNLPRLPRLAVNEREMIRLRKIPKNSARWSYTTSHRFKWGLSSPNDVGRIAQHVGREKKGMDSERERARERERNRSNQKYFSSKKIFLLVSLKRYNIRKKNVLSFFENCLLF